MYENGTLCLRNLAKHLGKLLGIQPDIVGIGDRVIEPRAADFDELWVVRIFRGAGDESDARPRVSIDGRFLGVTSGFPRIPQVDYCPDARGPRRTLAAGRDVIRAARAEHATRPGDSPVAEVEAPDIREIEGALPRRLVAPGEGRHG